MSDQNDSDLESEYDDGYMDVMFTVSNALPIEDSGEYRRIMNTVNTVLDKQHDALKESFRGDLERVTHQRDSLLALVEKIARNDSRTYRFDDSAMVTLHCTGGDLNMLTDLINSIRNAADETQ